MDIQKLAALVGNTGDGIMDFCRITSALRGADPDLVKEVNIVPLPEVIRRKIEKRVFPKYCYHNAFEAAKVAKKTNNDSVKYVLGYWHAIVPVEHCFIKIQDNYHDPTGEILFSDPLQYFSLYELALEDLSTVETYLRKRFQWKDSIDIGAFQMYLKKVGSIGGYRFIDPNI